MPTLSEADSKDLLASFGLPLLPERSLGAADEATEVANTIGYPCVMKLCGDTIAHKTERNLVRLGLADADQANAAADELFAAARPEDGDVSVLVAPMVRSSREFIVGADRTPDFGPVIMVGVGGIFAEVVQDVVFRLLPTDDRELHRMLEDLDGQALLEEFRGEPAVDRDALVAVVRSVAAAMTERSDIASIDVNPVLIADGQPVAVDALVQLV